MQAMFSAAVAIAMLAASGASAAPERLTGADIAELLTGNTAKGLWLGARYRQSFREGGVTLYAQEGSRTSRGRWRVDLEADLYVSCWEPSGCENWEVWQDGDVYFWSASGTPRADFIVLTGEDLVD